MEGDRITCGACQYLWTEWNSARHSRASLHKGYKPTKFKIEQEHAAWHALRIHRLKFHPQDADDMAHVPEVN